MKALILAFAVAAGLAACAEPAGGGTNAAASAKCSLSATVSVDVLSDALWRGVIWNDNPVWQPSVTLAYAAAELGKLSANLWASFDLTHRRGTLTHSRRAGGLQELDYTISYANRFGPVGVEVGHIWYTFPYENGPTDHDLYATATYENEIATPSASVYWNYSDSSGNDVSSVYFAFGLSRDFAVTKELTLTPKASLGFGDHAYTNSKGGAELTDQTFGISASYAVSDRLSVGAQLNYTWIPSHTLRKEGYMGGGKDQLLWGGVNVTLRF